MADHRNHKYIMFDKKVILFHHEDDFDDGFYEDVNGACYKIYTEKDFWICDGCEKEFENSRAKQYWSPYPNRSYCTQCVRIPTNTELLHAYITEMKSARKGN